MFPKDTDKKIHYGINPPVFSSLLMLFCDFRIYLYGHMCYARFDSKPMKF